MNLAEINALVEAIKARKAELKATEKSVKASANASIVDTVNEMISNNTLKVGMEVVVLYGSKNEEVTGTIVGVLSTDKKSLTIESKDFKSTKSGEEDTLKRRYIDKARFVKVA